MSDLSSSATTAVPEKHHVAFFRQSGWLMVANITGGLMSFGIQFLSKKVPEAEYAIFGTLLMVTACIPTMPLQMVFTQQTAKALAMNRERQLASMIRRAWVLTFVLWALAALVVVAFQGSIVQRWKLGSPAALWVTLPVVLVSLWMPMFSGVLQGKQDFLWLGWASIISGLARFGVALVLVMALHMGATGMITGAIAGVGIAALIGMWRTRNVWTLKAESFDWRSLMGQVLPLMLGFGACQFLFTADTMFAKAYFGENEMAHYVAAGTLSRALLWLVLPLAAVMFPKIVHSTAKSEKHNLLGIVLLGTAILGLCAGLGLWLVGAWVIPIVFPASYVQPMLALIPWYVGAMIPLALTNVLVNDLLARSQFRVVPVMVLVTVAYGFTLNFMLQKFPGRLEVVLQTLAAFNLLLLAVCAWFNWGVKPKAKMEDGR